MAVIEATKENFEKLVLENSIVIVDFWAPWCGPCRIFAPIFEETSEKYDDIVFVKVNTQEEQDLASYFNIRAIPTLMIFREQIGVFQQPGMISGGDLEGLIVKVKDLDMEDVRQKLAEHQQKQGEKA